MYIDHSVSKQNGKIYTRVLLRTSYREEGKVKHKTIANLSKCPKEEIEAIDLALKHKKDITELCSVKDIKTKVGLSVGVICLLNSLANKLHITKVLGNTRMGKLALWQVMARIIDQGSRLSAVRLAGQHAICDLIGLDTFNEDSLYENLDWLSDNQTNIEDNLFKARLSNEIPTLYLYDVTSSYFEGKANELSDFGYNRDGKKGKRQIVIGLLTDEDGVPVSVEVFKGNTTDQKTFLNQIKKLSLRFGVKDVTMVGDRGMIKSGQIKDLNEVQFHYITSITKPQIQSLIKGGLIRLSLFDENLCEVEIDGVRYILRRNPLRVNELEANREEKIEKIKKIVEKENNYLNSHKRAKIEIRFNKIQNWLKKLKVSDFCNIEAEERNFIVRVDEDEKKKAGELDGCYCIKTDLPKDKASKEKVHRRYKDLANVEQAFRTMKTELLETRPVYVRKQKRTRGHVFVVMLAYIIIKELKRLWAEIDVKTEEGLNELTVITADEIKIGKISYQQIPEPRELGIKLLKAALVTLPKVLPYRNVNVATRKKLIKGRKSR
ncbi:IS1634 family transposase [bacterium]|nr:IS1634 family transposase [bacterium]MBU1754438.1 IS1634 family transposase [bacterium]